MADVNGEEKPAAEEEKKPVEEAPPPAEKKEEKKEPSEPKSESAAAENDKNTAIENGEVKTGTGDTAPASAEKTITFKERFKQFSKFGDTKSDGRMITLSQSDKWMKQAKVIDKKVTTTDTGIYFKKFKMQKIPLNDYEKFLEDLAKSKKVELEEMKKKMVECGAPGLSSAAGGAAKSSPSAVERLTDVSKYTGSHKQRFDESGRGRGIAGRKDLPDKSGYVHGYQNKNTYDKTH